MVMLDKDEIAEIRRTLRLTAHEFGLEVGVTGNTVARWELGIRFPSRRHMLRLNEMRGKAERMKAFMASESA